MPRLYVDYFPLMHRIAFIERNGTLKGGGQQSLLSLIRHLDRTRFKPLAVLGEEGPLADALRDTGADCRVVPLSPFSLSGLPSVPVSLHALSRTLRETGAELLHANDSRSHVYAGLVARRLRLPCLFHYRVSYSDGLYDRLLPRLCDRIIAVSAAAAARFPGFGDKIRIIHNGVDLARFPLRPAVSLSTSAIRIGSVGRYGREKGFRVVLEAFAGVRERFPRAQLLLAGGGDEKEKRLLEGRIGELGLRGAVLLPGRIDDIASFLRSLDLFILMSENEGLNRSLLEAMASGVPVVASRVGGNPEILEDQVSGLLVPPGDAPAAAHAMRKLLNDAGFKAGLTNKARRVVEARFTIERHARAVEAVYGELLAR